MQHKPPRDPIQDDAPHGAVGFNHAILSLLLRWVLYPPVRPRFGAVGPSTSRGGGVVAWRRTGAGGDGWGRERTRGAGQGRVKIKWNR
jgi:hypothetical protein